MLDLGYEWDSESVELDAITLYILIYVAALVVLVGFHVLA
jgi:hypothetical protein